MRKFTLSVMVTVTLLALLLTARAGNGLGPNRVWGNGFFTNGLVVSGIPCRLYAATGYNSTSTNVFLMIFETNTAPAAATVPKLGPFPVGAGQFYSIDFSAYGADLDKVYVSMSTTSNGFTQAGTNFTFQAIVGNQDQ